MPAPLTSTHRDLQTHQPFYPALQNAMDQNVEYLVQTPLTITPPALPTGPILGIKLPDRRYYLQGISPRVIEQTSIMYVTEDGINWIPVPTPDDIWPVAVLNIPGTTKFVLESDVGVLYTSPDGLTWTMVDMLQSVDEFFNLLSYAGQYLFATSYTVPANPTASNNWNRLYASSDGGITWTLAHAMNGYTTPEGFRGVVFGDNLGVPV